MSQVELRQNAQSMIGQATPWRAVWWVVVVEGGLALVLGIYILVSPVQAAGGFVRLFGAYLVVEAVLAVYRLLTGKGEPSSAPGRWMRIGINFIAGLVAFGYPYMGTINAAAAATVLALGLLSSGAIALYAAYKTRASMGLGANRVLVPILYILFSILVFYHNIRATDLWILPTLGWIATLGGVTLLGYGYWLYRSQDAAVGEVVSDGPPVGASSMPTTPLPEQAVSAGNDTDAPVATEGTNKQ